MFLPLALLSVVMTLGAPQDSQTILARHAVGGVVEDPSGLPVPGAQVVLRKSGDSAPQQQKTTTSGEDGSFRFESVPKGKYLVEAFFEGFAPFQKKIVVKREVSSLRVRLKIARLDERSTVVAVEPTRLSTEPAENWDSIELDREMLDALPVMDQDVLSTAMEFLDDGALGSEGPTIVVDGVETDAIGVTPSAIEEVRINKNPYSAEYSRPGRGRVEVITKRGSQDFHGQFR